MKNILLSILDVAIEDRHHAVSQDVERYEAVPLDDHPPLEDPEVLYNRGFGDGWASNPQDKQFTWSLDYMAGFTDAVADSILSGNSVQYCLTHTENDEF